MVVATQKKRPEVAVTREEIATPPESSDEIVTFKWEASSYITCTSDKGVKRYLRQRTMEDLLSQVQDGQPFRLKSLRLSDALGMSEFYLAKAWLVANGLAMKSPNSSYVIMSIERVKRRWNEVIQHEAAL